MAPTIEKSEQSVVVLGGFNPLVFHPLWFSTEGLLAVAEADSAEVQILHPDVAQFTADWVRVFVAKDRLVLATSQESHSEPLRDLAVGVLELLRHTPTIGVGINNDCLMHFKDDSSWNAFGWKLVPPVNWDGVLQNPGMAQVVVQSERKDGRDGYMRINIDPRLDGSRVLGLRVNDHVQMPSALPSNTAEIAEIIGERWHGARAEADAVFDWCVGLAK